SSRRRHTRSKRDWSSDVCSSDLMIVVYPVEDPERWTDHSGNVLPDAILMRKGVTLKELALRIHTDLGERMLYGVNARNGMRLGRSEERRVGKDGRGRWEREWGGE